MVDKNSADKLISFEHDLEGKFLERICYISIPPTKGVLEKPDVSLLKQERSYEIDGLLKLKKKMNIKGKYNLK
jgi:hypothetical protein